MTIERLKELEAKATKGLWYAELSSLRKTAPALIAVAEALKSVQWVSCSNGFQSYCPSCGCFHEDGHDKDCFLAAALAALEESK